MNTEAQASYDYRHWIYEKWRQGKAKNPRWSLRNFAKKLSISPSALSEILAGKRHITKKMAERLAVGLKLSPVQTQLFVRSVVLAKMLHSLPDDVEINKLSDSLFTPLDPEVFKIISQWYHFAILSLADSQKCPCKNEWIAKRLGITRIEASQATKRLFKLGFIAKQEGRWKPTQKSLSILTQGYETAIREFIGQNLDKAKLSLETVPPEQREICAITMAVDPRNLPKAQEAIKRFRRELCDLLEQGDKKRVYTLGVQLFPVDVGYPE